MEDGIFNKGGACEPEGLRSEEKARQAEVDS